ncbi:MAG: tRNA pseudouridine(55) synthase TruB [Ignavibacteriales bacterium CG_4_9_14_3_um_filter_34_10]|nr:MAG: tRNA pseudouridine(55) synthase TruB [Ignavibacteriales bacterium CG_4_9_14_3_um_filter_34_10]
MITKTTTDFTLQNLEEGEVILIDKVFRQTSFGVVDKIKKLTKIKKVGHAGTLDPFATGLLIVCTGKKTKEVTTFQDLHKTYKGHFTLGKVTLSMDTETEFIEEYDYSDVTLEQIENVRQKFLGEIDQIPPMFSAIKHKGKPLYHFARQGKVITREPRKINIISFEINKIELPVIHFKIICSKGTYIRSIANDFGREIGCGAYLSELRRTNIGEYDVADAFSVFEFMDLIKANTGKT